MSEKRILIVEDEVIVAMTLEDTLVSLGYMVVGSVTNGPDAIQKAGDERPDLILMDIRLDGEMDGIEAAERIHALYKIPVLYLTAHSDDITLSRALKTQPYGYLHKPFRERELYTNIEMALHKHRVLQNIGDSPADSPAVTRDPSPSRTDGGMAVRLLDGIGKPVYVVDQNKKLVLFNEPFSRLFQELGTGELVLRRPVYELAPSSLMGSVGDYNEIFTRGTAKTEYCTIKTPEHPLILEIRRFPIPDQNEVRFIGVIVSDVSRHAMLEQRTMQLQKSVDDVIGLLGQVVALKRMEQSERLLPLATRAEELVIALSQVDAEWMKYEQKAQHAPWEQ